MSGNAILKYRGHAKVTEKVALCLAFLGYVVVGILAFLLGISLTLMCDILHKRNKERNEGNDRTDESVRKSL